MKRYFMHFFDSPGEYVVKWADLQSRDLKLAELAKALPHGHDCAAYVCACCDSDAPRHSF
jgi:hypothetical protein